MPAPPGVSAKQTQANIDTAVNSPPSPDDLTRFVGIITSYRDVDIAGDMYDDELYAIFSAAQRCLCVLGASAEMFRALRRCTLRIRPVIAILRRASVAHVRARYNRVAAALLGVHPRFLATAPIDDREQLVAALQRFCYPDDIVDCIRVDWDGCPSAFWRVVSERDASAVMCTCCEEDRRAAATVAAARAAAAAEVARARQPPGGAVKTKSVRVYRRNKSI